MKSLVWQNFSLIFDSVDFEKYVGNVIAYIKLARCFKLAVYRQGRAKSVLIHLGSVHCAS